MDRSLIFTICGIQVMTSGQCLYAHVCLGGIFRIYCIRTCLPGWDLYIYKICTCLWNAIYIKLRELDHIWLLQSIWPAGFRSYLLMGSVDLDHSKILAGVGSVRPARSAVCPRVINTSTWYMSQPIPVSQPASKLITLHARSELHTTWQHFKNSDQAWMNTLTFDS